MRMLVYVIALMLMGRTGAVQIPLNGPRPDNTETSKFAARPLRIAIVQMKSLDHDIDANLRQASIYADEAAARRAQFVLFPELMATGSYLSFYTWDSAEPSHGKTVQWLKSTSRRLHIWLGAGFFEASGADFYDTFVLTAPSGDEAGRVRKQIPAGPEGYFFRGDVGPHVIPTAIGKIGVGICAESYYCFAASQFLKDSADFILMRHSSPDMSNGGGLPSPPGTHIASWYAKKFGVPVVMVNKVGRSYKPPPNEINGIFPGRSAIVDSDGTILQSMANQEGIGIANITIDPARKTRADQVCTGVGIAELAVGGSAGAAAVAEEYARAKKSYDNNPVRKAKALSISPKR
ncbi:MAG: carbon-nitrogen hydrolase family protein [Acidobacteriaceae bacterium]|nr:carbon-nitrogen hydrolase family protein [Acidobacteriaceae bacterium]MBV9499852.1 carbon-nitrogen hydrolase family protein [Acidobacteriaceae bacterium]